MKFQMSIVFSSAKEIEKTLEALKTCRDSMIDDTLLDPDFRIETEKSVNKIIDAIEGNDE